MVFLISSTQSGDEGVWFGAREASHTPKQGRREEVQVC